MRFLRMDLLLSKKLSESIGLVNSDGFMMNASRRLSLGGGRLPLCVLLSREAAGNYEKELCF
jgi:hypothetical protein